MLSRAFGSRASLSPNSSSGYLLGHASPPSLSVSSSLHNNAPRSSFPLRNCLCSRRLAIRSQAVTTIVCGGCCSDDAAGVETVSDGCVSNDHPHAGNWTSSVSFGGLPTLESVTHAGARGCHPSREASRLMAQMANDFTDEAPQLPEELEASALPKHVAIIMDGNSRWAERRGLPASMGHEAGVRSLQEVVKLAQAWGIQVLTVFAFSTENWLRPKMEVDFLMLLFENVLKNELSTLAKENIRVHCMGDMTMLPESLRSMVTTLDEHTKHNSGLKLCIALSYSGRDDIATACQRLAAKVEAGELHASDITEAAIEEELRTSWLGDARDPDLLVRTSGEQRLSNFLLWQSAYTEFHFVDSLWPDFGVSQFKQALLAYQNRNRRFGKRK